MSTPKPFLIRRDRAVVDRASGSVVGQTYKIYGEWAATTTDGRVFYGGIFGRQWAVEQMWHETHRKA